jgi:ketosteroid isomerase-like protein
VSNGGRREVARDPQDLERFFVARQRAGDVDGMMALYEPDAVVDPGDGQLLRGTEAIRAFFEKVIASGQKYNYGEQRPALISGDLAMTSMRSPGGNVTTEIARRQPDGSWLWVIDRFIVN